jgi:hypothetical protein
MAHFGKGGVSYPDFLIGLVLLFCVCTSTLLNAVVLHHNRPPTSIPKFMFTTISIINLVMAPYIGIHASFQILQPEESPFFSMSWEDTQILTKCCGMFSNNATYQVPHFWNFHKAKTTSQILGGLTWIFIAIPPFLTGLQTCVRFLQIRYPFWLIERKYLTVLITVYIAYLITYQCSMVLTRNVYWFALIQTIIWLNNKPSDISTSWITIIYFSPCMVMEILAILASFSTIYELYKIRKTNLASVQRKNIRGTVKIFLENALNIICLGTQMSVFMMFEDGNAVLDPTMSNQDQSYIWRLLSFTVGLPIVGCALYPCIYIALTPKSVKILAPYMKIFGRYCENKTGNFLKWFDSTILDNIKSFVSARCQIMTGGKRRSPPKEITSVETKL